MDTEKCCLETWNLPPAISNAYAANGVERMFAWQSECLSLPGILQGKNLIYSAPTSAGKTLVAEILALKTVIERSKKAMLILPYKAVVHEKAKYLQKLLQCQGLKVGAFMGKQSPPGGLASVQIAVCVIEKANSMINRLMMDDNLNDIGIIIVDELHQISDFSRGYILELLITKILYLQGRYTNRDRIQIVGMSATLPNLKALADWMNATLYTTDFRPVPLKKFAVYRSHVYDESLKTIGKVSPAVKIENDEKHIAWLCLQTVLRGHSALVFCSTKAQVEAVATKIALTFYKIGMQGSSANKCNFSTQLRDQLKPGPIQELLEQLKRCPVGLASVVKKVISFGVGIHHAGLSEEEREIIESGFRASTLRVMVATSTLCSGVNLPARSVIICYSNYLTQMMYQQMAGRAGRMGIDTSGDSYLVLETKSKLEDAAEIMQPILQQPIKSSLWREAGLSTAFIQSILELIACEVGDTVADLKQYLQCSLHVSLLKGEGQTLSQIEPKIVECVNYLCNNELIREQNGTSKLLVATRLGKACLAAAMQPDDALELYIELERAQRNFVLSSELHLIYLAVPQLGVVSFSDIDWYRWMTQFAQLPPLHRTVADAVGVEESFIHKCFRYVENPRSVTQQKLLIVARHVRFRKALALFDLVNEVSLDIVADNLEVSRGVMQSLQHAASMQAGRVTAFCHELGWRSMEVLMTSFQDRLQFGIQHELCEIMQVSYLNAQRARSLYEAGFTTLSKLSHASVDVIEKTLANMGPFEAKRDQEGESKYTANKRREMKSLFVTGQAGMTEREAAEAIVAEARKHIQDELGLSNIIWDKSEEAELIVGAQVAKRNESSNSPDEESAERSEIKTPVKVDTSEKIEIPMKIKTPVNSNTHNSAKKVSTMKRLHNGNSPIEGPSGVTKHSASKNRRAGHSVLQGSPLSLTLTPPSTGTPQSNKVIDTPQVRKTIVTSKNGEAIGTPGKRDHIETPKSRQEIETPKNRQNSNESKNVSPDMFEDSPKGTVTTSEISKDLSPDMFENSQKNTVTTTKVSNVSPVMFENSQKDTVTTTKISNNTSPVMFENSQKDAVTTSEITAQVIQQSVKDANVKDSLSVYDVSVLDDDLVRIMDQLEANLNGESLYVKPSDNFNLDKEILEINKVISQTSVKNDSPVFIDSLDELANLSILDESPSQIQQRLESDLFSVARVTSVTPVATKTISASRETSTPINNPPNILPSKLGSKSLAPTTKCIETRLKENKSLENWKVKPKTDSIFTKTTNQVPIIDQVHKSSVNTRSSARLVPNATSPSMLRAADLSKIQQIAQSKTEPKCNNSKIDILMVGKKDLYATFTRELLSKPKISVSVACESFHKERIGETALNSEIIDAPRVKNTPGTGHPNLKIIGIGVFWGGNTSYYLDLIEETGAVSLSTKLKLVQQFLEKSSNCIYFYNAKEQLLVLKQWIDLNLSRVHVGGDPMIASWLLNPDSEDHQTLQTLLHLSKLEQSVDHCPQVLSSFDEYSELLPSFGNRRGLANKRSSNCAERAAMEAYLTFHLCEILYSNLEKEGLISAYTEVELPLVRVLVASEAAGFHFNFERGKVLMKDLEQQKARLESTAHELVNWKFNLHSHKQIATALYDKLGLRILKDGKEHRPKSTNKDTLQKIINKDCPMPGVVLDYRKIEYIITQIFTPFFQLYERLGGIERIHPCYTTRTSTGRIYMKDPNFQNIPRDFSVQNLKISPRLAFEAGPNNILISADYKQVELRLLAHFSKDPSLMSVVCSENDLFRDMAASLNSVAYNQVTDVQRQHAKQICYGIMYGMTPERLMFEIECESVVAARTFMDEFATKFPKANSFLKATADKVYSLKYVETLKGRKRYFNVSPNTKHGPSERQAMNTVLQGSAADISKMALIKIQTLLERNNLDKHTKLVLHLHDELIYETRLFDAKKVANIVRLGMEKVVKLNVPLPVKLRKGRSWGQLSETD